MGVKYVCTHRVGVAGSEFRPARYTDNPTPTTNAPTLPVYRFMVLSAQATPAFGVSFGVSCKVFFLFFFCAHLRQEGCGLKPCFAAAVGLQQGPEG